MIDIEEIEKQEEATEEALFKMNQKRIPSYSKIYAFGHPALMDLRDGKLLIEEKVDGSQFSFAKFDGEIMMRSKGAEVFLGTADKLFAPAAAAVNDREALLHDGWVYRAETLCSPKHNTLAYERAPKDNLVIFDIERGPNDFLSHEERRVECERIGLDCIPLLEVLDDGAELSLDLVKALLRRDSYLGGQKVEGVVVKNHLRFGRDGKALMGKHVSEAFKEVHAGSWKKEHPGRKDIMLGLGDKYKSPARWQKSVQHLAERGELERSPRDIGNLIKEVKIDIEAECKEEIMEQLWAFAWPQIARMVTGGLPEWYKEQLLESQFEGDANAQ